MLSMPLSQFGIAGGAIAVLFVFGMVIYQLLGIAQQKKSNGSSQTACPNPDTALAELIQNNNLALRGINKAIDNNTETLKALQTMLGKLLDDSSRQGAQMEELLARSRAS